MLTSQPFAEALASWEAAASSCLAARVAYETAYATAILSADAKTAEARKAQADSTTMASWQAWKAADITATAAWQIVLFLTPAAPAARPVLA